MKLWKLSPADPYSPEFRSDYLKAFGFVVRADSEQDARQLANEHAGRERGATGVDEFGRRGGDPWLNPAATKCEPLVEEGTPRVILRSAFTDQQAALANPAESLELENANSN